MQMKDITETQVMVFYSSPLRHIIVTIVGCLSCLLLPNPFLNCSMELHMLLKPTQANCLYGHRPLHKLNWI